MQQRHKKDVQILPLAIIFIYNDIFDSEPAMTDSLNFRHLLAALEIRKSGSISAATEPMFLSQSAITQALSKLEKTLGHRLFTRTSKGLYPTEVGEVFLQRIERAVHWLTLLDSLFPAKGKGNPRIYRRISTAQLTALVTVVDYGNYSLAAAHLSLTQPTLHRAIRELEGLCGRSFFQRSPSGVEPNWQSRQAARYASLYFSELAQGIDEVEEYVGNIIGSLRVGSLPLARTRIAPKAVTQLLEEFPSARISIVDGPYQEQLDMLRHGRLDLIIGALRNPAPSSGIDQQTLFTDSLHIVVRPGHPIARQKSISVLKLQELQWIAPSENAPARAAFTKFFEARGLQPPEHVIECSSLIATRGLLLESNRAALLSKRQVEIEVASDLLAVSPMKLSGMRRDIGITTRSNWKPTKLQSRFIDLLYSQFRIDH